MARQPANLHILFARRAGGGILFPRMDLPTSVRSCPYNAGTPHAQAMGFAGRICGTLLQFLACEGQTITYGALLVQ